MLSTCVQAFTLELQAFSALPFQQTTDLVEKLRPTPRPVALSL